MVTLRNDPPASASIHPSSEMAKSNVNNIDCAALANA